MTRNLIRSCRCIVVCLLFGCATGCAIHDSWQPTVGEVDLTSSLALQTHKPGQRVSTDVLKPDDPAPLPSGPVAFTVEEAVLMALENNRALRVERLGPSIARTFVEQELALFDPVLSGTGSAGGERTKTRAGEQQRTSTHGAGAAVSKYNPTGTDVRLEATTDRSYGPKLTDRHATRVGLTVTQALLRGFGPQVNLASLRQSRLDALFSQYEFRGFAEALVADVETTYWQYVLARRQVAIVKASLELAQKQLEDTEHRVRVGGLAETELAAGQAEVALRREALINATSRVDRLAVQLLRLVYPRRLASAERVVVAETEPVVLPLPDEPAADHVDLAMQLRPELKQAAILIERGELEIVKTKNGLLPRMDLFVSLGKTGYAESFSKSLHTIEHDGWDAFVGVSMEYPLGNRDARARHSRAVLTKQQREESLANLRDLVRQDVEQALIEVKRTRQLVDATAVTRKAQEETVRAETAKYRVGKSTSLLVATAQRDLLAAQVAEVEAVTNYLNARVDLFRVEGSLLTRRGLAAPGGMVSPVRQPAP